MTKNKLERYEKVVETDINKAYQVFFWSIWLVGISLIIIFKYFLKAEVLIFEWLLLGFFLSSVFHSIFDYCKSREVYWRKLK